MILVDVIDHVYYAYRNHPHIIVYVAPKITITFTCVPNTGVISICLIWVMDAGAIVGTVEGISCWLITLRAFHPSRRAFQRDIVLLRMIVQVICPASADGKQLRQIEMCF
jgi:hypothetical protein